MSRSPLQKDLGGLSESLDLSLSELTGTEGLFLSGTVSPWENSLNWPCMCVLQILCGVRRQGKVHLSNTIFGLLLQVRFRGQVGRYLLSTRCNTGQPNIQQSPR